MRISVIDTAVIIRYLIRIYLMLPVRPFQGILTKLFWKYKITKKGKVVITTIDGITYSLDLGEVIDSFIYYSGCFEPMTTAFINKNIEEGMTVLDIGANIGCHTLRFAKLVGESGRVIAFEPTSWAFSRLRRNTELNDFSNITLEKLAVSDTSQKLLTCFPSSFTVETGGLPGPTYAEEVTFITLDEYISENNMNRVDLIKIDVDGYEYKVIHGGLRTIARFKPIMIVEFGKNTLKRYGDNLQDLIDLLSSLGYSFYSDKDLRKYKNKEELFNAVPEEGEIINVICRVVD